MIDADAIDRVHSLYQRRLVERGHVFAGWPVIQCPLDLWSYQEVIYRTLPPAIVQTGIYEGGSLLWFAFMMDLLQYPESGIVVGIDVKLTDGARALAKHPRIRIVEGDSGSLDVFERVARMVGWEAMVSLDSDHRAAHVGRELRLWPAIVPEGKYLVVEDTNLNGHPAAPDHGIGPYEAMAEWLQFDPPFEIDADVPRNTLFSFHTWLRRTV